MRVLIIGCGYVGVETGRLLAAAGHEVYGARRSEDAAEALRAAGLHPLTLDATRLADLERLPGPFDWVVNTTAASDNTESGYRQAYVETNARLLEWMARQPPRKFVYTSSTGVYGQEDGTLVKESSPTEPASATGRVLVEAEQRLLAAAREGKAPAVILRLAGIYGPGRLRLLRQYMKNEARLEGRGERWMNLIHRDDAAGCIMAALRHGRPGEVYNAVDDEPVTQLRYFQWLSQVLGKWLPPTDAGESSGGSPRAQNKRVSNRKLKTELGYAFKYPTFRDGLTAEIARLQEANDFEIAPDPR